MDSEGPARLKQLRSEFALSRLRASGSPDIILSDGGTLKVTHHFLGREKKLEEKQQQNRTPKKASALSVSIKVLKN